jgi:glutamyl/glutaminyl-tRNA synthetase
MSGSRAAGEAGRVYRCYETAQELELKRKVLLGRGLPPIYDPRRAAAHEADHAAKRGGRAAALALQARSRRAHRVA